jgi:transcriptional regulator of arginine metabolism
VAKAGDHYILPGGDSNAAGTPFAAVSNFVTEVRTAGQSLTVVKTTTGTAQSVAVAIDDSNWSEVVGTISGDDTIFIATEGGREQRKLRERLRDIFGI